VNFAGFRKFLAEYSSLHPVLALPLVEVGGSAQGAEPKGAPKRTKKYDCVREVTHIHQVKLNEHDEN